MIRIRAVTKQLRLTKSSYYRRNDIRLQNIKDFKTFKLIEKYFEKGKRKIGILQLQMRIERTEKISLGHNRIARIKKKFGLKTEIRKKNTYRFFAKKQQEHDTCPNILSRAFEVNKPDHVYSTDITELPYFGGKVYLAAVKDLCTKEIVAHTIGKRINVELTNTTIKKALKKIPENKRKSLIIHSDQGFNFTHISYRKLLDDAGVLQSMSRKGNCLDNAPIESFFGHIKDHIDLKTCKFFEEVQKLVTKEINYYNHHRPQFGLKKMPPSLYRRHLKST